MDKIFNEDQKDMLRELMNISLGETTSNLAKLLNAFGTMHIPKISIVDAKDLHFFISKDLDSSKDYFVTKQLFSGLFGGEVIFTIDQTSSQNLAKNVFNTPEPSEDDISDATMELTNIVTSTIVSKLANELNVNVQFLAPASYVIKPREIIDREEIINYSTVIILETMVEFRDENIFGYIFILTKNGSIERLKNLIDQKLEELFA